MSLWFWSMSMLKLAETFPRVYQRQLLPTSTVKVCLLVSEERSRSSWHKLFRNAGCVLCVEMLFPVLISRRWSVSAAGQSCRLPAGSKWILNSTFQLSTTHTQADPLLGLSCSTVSDLLARKNLSYCKILNEQDSFNSKGVLVLRERTASHFRALNPKKRGENLSTSKFLPTDTKLLSNGKAMELLQLVNKSVYPSVFVLSILKVSEVEFFNATSDSTGMVPAGGKGLESWSSLAGAWYLVSWQDCISH